MTLIIAANIGFCYGVKNLVQSVTKESKKGLSVGTHGALFHNSKALNVLHKHNIQNICNQQKSDLKADVVAIRAHGVSKQTLSKLKESKTKIIDGTCPFVQKTHNIVDSLVSEGYFLVLLGQKKHPEIMAIEESFRPQCHVVESLQDLQTLPNKKKIGIVFQSTVLPEDFIDVFPQLMRKAQEIKIHPTICNITTQRQNEIKNLSRQVDFMFVLGGATSVNSRKLGQSSACPHALVENPHDLIQHPIPEKTKTIGLITGTSTPVEFAHEAIHVLKKRYPKLKTKFQDPRFENAQFGSTVFHQTPHAENKYE